MENKNEEKLNWSIIGIWEDVINSHLDDIKYRPRNYIYSSELGKPFRDRFFAMKGIHPTNPFGARVERLFLEGESKEKEMMKIFEMVGLLKGYQIGIKLPEDSEHLEVRGRIDILAGGEINKEEKIQELSNQIEDLEKNPDNGATDLIIRKSALKFLKSSPSSNFKDLVYEVKSLNSKAFWRLSKSVGKPYIHHELQLWTYLKAKNIEEGRLLYISRDDGSLFEAPVFLNDKRLENIYEEDVKTMTRYFREDKIPPCEPWIVEDEYHRLVNNWKLARSPYLTKITGLKLFQFKLVTNNLKLLAKEVKRSKN